MEQKKSNNIKSIIVIVIIALIVFIGINSCSSGGHAPGYGKTNKCTICGKPATHKTSNYGFCNKHWNKATGN